MRVYVNRVQGPPNNSLQPAVRRDFCQRAGSILPLRAARG